MNPRKFVAALAAASFALFGAAQAFDFVECGSCSVPIPGQEFYIGTYNTFGAAAAASQDTTVLWPAFLAARDAALALVECDACEDPTSCERVPTHSPGGQTFCQVVPAGNKFELYGFPDDSTFWWVSCHPCDTQSDG
jgi:hypothetical protein